MLEFLFWCCWSSFVVCWWWLFVVAVDVGWLVVVVLCYCFVAIKQYYRVPLLLCDIVVVG